MKRRYTWILIVLAAVASFYFFGPLVLNWILTPSVRRPHSDVPISCELGSWPYQDGLTVTKLSAEPVDPKLNLFNNRFLLRYRVAGAITYRRGWRPRVAKAQVTARLVSARTDEKPPVADISVVPIVVVTQDASYSQEQVPFDIKLEQVMQTMDWGRNQYEIHCLGQAAAVSVQQSK